MGLSEGKRIIFVCAARHIGLALAKGVLVQGVHLRSVVRVKMIFVYIISAVNYTRNKRSGGIGKVDNSVGTNVEIMICDVQSFRPL